ncbi:DUF2092 domain-containing protein [Pseudomonas lundensis]|nr:MULTISPECIES: DUF2092 domain-containing protein [Pseudomonas]AOZ14477.1 hypothetical protein AA042_18855 [Pseudomonas lundensis]
MQALARMGSDLRSLKQFGAQIDHVLENGQSIEIRHHTRLLAKQPDKLMVTVDNQGKHRSLYYDGHAFTVYQSPARITPAPWRRNRGLK